MTDFKSSIKIEFEFMGVKDKCDMYINYSGDSNDVDDRVADFFREVYEKGMINYNNILAKDAEKEEQIMEKAELKRLKKKYEQWNKQYLSQIIIN